jgi:CDP-paratose 2-epimerase
MAREKEKILITGGLGFIGSNLAKRLSKRYQIVIVDYDHSTEAEETALDLQRIGAKVIRKDISVQQTWTGVPSCQYIFHAAAQVAAEVSWEKPSNDLKTNVNGTFWVAEYGRKHNAKIIYCNTIRIYDPEAIEKAMQKNGNVSEECPTIEISNKPQPPFALSKYMGEQYLHFYSRMYGLKVISNRMSSIVGAGQTGSKTHGWLANIIRCAVQKKEYTIFGDGNQTRDVLHINDFIRIIENELAYFNKYSENGFMVYNMGGGNSNELSINQAIKIAEKELSIQMKIKKGPPRIGEPVKYCSDFTRLKRIGLPFDKPRSLKDIIADLIYYYNNGEGERDGRRKKPRRD